MNSLYLNWECGFYHLDKNLERHVVSANTVIKTITENSFLKDRSEKVNFELSKEREYTK